MKTKRKAALNVKEMVLEAVRSSQGRYQYRSAPGISKQTGIHIEYVEQILVDLAQKGLVMVGQDSDQVVWAQLEETYEDLA